MITIPGTTTPYFPHLELGDAVATGPALLARIRQERILADRALILSDLEPSSAPVFVGMAARVSNVVDVNAVALPSVGYGTVTDRLAEDAGDAPAIDGAAAPDEPDADDPVGGDAPAGDAVAGGLPLQGQGLVASTPTKRELAFLDDKSLPIEEKLFRFMALMAKKSDQDLVAYMKEISGKKASSSSSSSSGSSTGSSSSAGAGSSTDGAPSTDAGGSVDAGGGSPPSEAQLIARLPPPYNRMTMDELRSKFDTTQIVNLLRSGDPYAYAGFFSTFDHVASVVGDAASWAGKELAHGAAAMVRDQAGPALAIAVSAAGFPELAPAAKWLGGELGGVVADELDERVRGDEPKATGQAATPAQQSSSAAAEAGSEQAEAAPTVASATSSSSSASTTSAVDERIQIANLQRLMDNQSAMLAALSNALKSAHDTRMSIIQNVK